VGAGARRRSSILSQPLLEAIRETEDETFDETYHFDLLALGGGVATGHWARAISGSLAERGLTAGIISGDCPGLAPYERPALSKDFLNPGQDCLFDFADSGPSNFPFCCKGSGGNGQSSQWYEEQGITLLFSCQAIRANLDSKIITVKRVLPDGNDGLLYQQTLKVEYKKLIIATGVRPRRILDNTCGNFAKSIQGSCFCSRHSDISGSPPVLSEPERFGFGSVHYLRDLGDAMKLVEAMGGVEADGQETCRDAVVVVGGGLISCEVASAIATFYGDISLTMVIPGEEVLQGTGFGKDVGRFYEKQLSRAMKLAKGYRVSRLWDLEEVGDFPTLEQTPNGPSLKKTLPRTFGPADPCFTTCRGLVLSSTQSGEVWLPARFVVVGIGSIPNSELFASSLKMNPDGGIITDSSLRASHPSRDVFAAGDVASAPLPLAGGRQVRMEHVHWAREMGQHVAQVMLEPEGQQATGPFNAVPSFYSRFLDLSWQFYGFTEGEVVILGMDTFPSSRSFGAFWLKDGRIVGALLETSSSEVDHSVILERIARERPRVLSTKRLSK
ncbi:unnamed protein product, partial [Discosporangium mesarthrocarpum]